MKGVSLFYKFTASSVWFFTIYLALTCFEKRTYLVVQATINALFWVQHTKELRQEIDLTLCAT